MGPHRSHSGSRSGTTPDCTPACERDAACPISTGGGTRRVHLVREGGGAAPPPQQSRRGPIHPPARPNAARRRVASPAPPRRRGPAPRRWSRRRRRGSRAARQPRRTQRASRASRVGPRRRRARRAAWAPASRGVTTLGAIPDAVSRAATRRSAASRHGRRERGSASRAAPGVSQGTRPARVGGGRDRGRESLRFRSHGPPSKK